MSRSHLDRWLRFALGLTGLLSGMIVVFIALFLLREGWPALHEIGIWSLVTDAGWYPLEGRFGMWPMVVGTLAVTAGALLLAAPLGVGSAVFGEYLAPRPVAAVYDRLVNLLAGIPSVVYGFWGVVVLVPLIARIRQPGSSLLAGCLILGLMTLPTVAIITRAGLRAVPADHLLAAAALGLSRWRTLRSVVWPNVRSSVLTALVLATGRAVGETMAVLMVCGNVVQVPGSVFEPVRVLTANIALEMAYAEGLHRHSLFATGLLLLALVGLLVVSAECLTRGPTLPETDQ